MTINATIPQEGQMRITVFNAAGEIVGVVADGVFTKGTHIFQFNAGGYSAGTMYVHMATYAGNITSAFIINR